ncbi:MAG: hypothetical protein J7500_11500 [Sphingomonas sp.]|uniref:hypothetical protein n=1 Tax=Sphingomonas sp. TaxID=28214 RepID=UPI001B25CDA8|nr:hypothetical protein [Sphingomonas sp.]MBO9623325.1 hypothetical protein [Sphingomonas sp.]
MIQSTPAVTFSGSRLKLVPQAIMNLAFILPFGLLWIGLVFEIGSNAGTTPRILAGGMLVTLVVAVFIWFQLLTLRRMAKPDLLTVTPAGLDLIMAGRRQHHLWATLGEPEIRLLGGKSAARSIVLPLRAGGRVIILAEGYSSRAEDILRALRQAKAGLAIEPPRRSSQALYIFLAIPASCFVLGIVLAGLGAILFN